MTPDRGENTGAAPAFSARSAAPGTPLPDLSLDITPTVVVAAALASRDFERVHHDRDAARNSGLPDVFLNIFASNGFVVRFVTDWAGPDAIVKEADIRLGVPHYAGETLHLTGAVESVDDAGNITVAVRGRNTTGDHVTGTVMVNLANGRTS